uniref:U6 snRNA-associated Sm-like protein LSm4 n=1 Tax=Chromera velia CCMP2878 TaxID=1169474 RepID=A0A0G4FPE6_9ALVE|eukprot:Cvel_18065.t1-p1 / transcript=Cvel_18065.t1 / gene=Cvel_18065 / organism=Chromera_velia_CCMP2878 / gene_product=U6 snRNA-associated Sm-like protein LSm4, putative / transcript_product=U6 snRNA-associated Sm-like protein LSm4, putative / location=Cvel_scaffold1477:11806-16956(-) / protein_length=227 / sequence_SO=supercontig / SO=protein_coding / is_pseudo=false
MVLPLTLLRTAHNHPMMVELKNGETYSGVLAGSDNFMNLQMRDVVLTSREGDKFWKLSECCIRGNNIKYMRLPDEIIDMAIDTEPGRDNRGPAARGRGGRGRGRGGPVQGRGPAFQSEQKGRELTNTKENIRSSLKSILTSICLAILLRPSMEFHSTHNFEGMRGQRELHRGSPVPYEESFGGLLVAISFSAERSCRMEEPTYGNSCTDDRTISPPLILTCSKGCIC